MTSSVSITALDHCDVSPDGRHIRFGVRDGAGEQVELYITTEQAGSLAMTLPKLLSAALQARFRDPSIRMVFPLSDYFIERAGGSDDLILSLKTSDGFEVSFGVSASTLSELGQVAGDRTPDAFGIALLN